MPFIWNYPNGFKPKVISDQTVSYVDVYRTLADVIDPRRRLPCNEAPDSRSILKTLTGRGKVSGDVGKGVQ